LKVAGIIAEFNPFHNGHAALAQAARQSGATHVAAVMSGNFVQRGGPAIAEKRVRAHAALLGGVDLVLELPLPFATATAQRFALGGVGLLAATGRVDLLCFGSESGDVPALAQLAELLDDAELDKHIQRRLRTGDTYAKARQLAVEELSRGVFPGLASPNDTLAVEYLRAARQLNWCPQVFALRRRGVAHDQSTPSGAFASASHLRGIAADWDSLGRHMPRAGVLVLRDAQQRGLYPAALSLAERAVLTQLRSLPRQALAELPDLSEGLENRLYGAIRQAVSLEELYALLKTKRYTLARLRRLVLHAFLGITKHDTATPAPYLRVLGFNRRGGDILGHMNASLPVDTRLARLRRQSPVCGRFAHLEEHATDLYTLMLPQPQPCGYDYTAGAVYLK